MVFASPLQTTAEFQWDPDSRPNQPQNCGPSSAEKIANFYKDLTTYGIERTRDLGSSRNGTGTNTTEQKAMLEKRGIPSSAMQLSLAEIKKTLSTGRRPIILWLVMSEIPANIRRHDFLGWHAVAGLANGIVSGTTGVWIMDPNFHRDRTVHPDKIFVPDAYLDKASRAANRWCIVPNSDKVITTRTAYKKKCTVITTTLNVRSAPTATARDLGNLVRGAVITSNLLEKAGGSYKVGEVTRRDWIGFIRSGKQAWVARGYLRES